MFRQHHRHSEGANQLDECAASVTSGSPSWRVYLKYNEANDEIIFTFLPLKLFDVELLEKQLPEVFRDLMGMGESDTVSEISSRQRNESFCSTTDSEKIAHTHILPIFVCTAVHSRLKLSDDTIGFEAHDRRWASCCESLGFFIL